MTRNTRCLGTVKKMNVHELVANRHFADVKELTQVLGRKPVVFLDAGHGGGDGGAFGSYSKESDNVLKVALKVATSLRGLGFVVYLSRDADYFVTLERRVEMANNAGCDIFISLHNNSASNPTAHGFESFISGNSPHTKRLQRVLHNAIASNIPLYDRGMKNVGFYVIRFTYAPAILLEYAFINNPKEENWLTREIDLQARLTVQGILNYFNVATTPQKDKGELTVGQYEELNKKISALEEKLNAKGNPTNQEYDEPIAWAKKHGVFNGENMSAYATRAHVAKALYTLSSEAPGATLANELPAFYKAMYDQGTFATDMSKEFNGVPIKDMPLQWHVERMLTAIARLNK